MKRNFLLSFAIIIATSQIVNAQITKGDIMLGGSFGFSTYKIDSKLVGSDRKQFSFNFSPAAGKAIKDNLVLGGEIILSSVDDEYANSSDTYKSFGAGIGGFLRQYVEIAKRLYLFGQGRFAVTYVREQQKNINFKTDSKGYNMDLTLYPGLSFAIKKNFHLETSLNNLVSLNFSHRKISQSTSIHNISKTNNFSLGSNLFSQSGFAVGLRFFI